MGRSKSLLFLMTLTSLLVAAPVDLIQQGAPSLGLLESGTAYARSSGGRSRGGSFKSSPSRTTNSTPSSDRSSDRSRDRSTYSTPTYRDNRGPVIVPVPVPANPSYSNSSPNYNRSDTSTSSEISDGEAIIVLLVFLVILGLGVWGLFKFWRFISGSGTGAGTQEVDNDTVTVSRLQVALLAEARSIQAQLTELTQETDVESEPDLLEQLQESALALLRSPENWSHVAAKSQTVQSREDAEALFEQWSIAERSKFSAETLVNVGGKVRQQKPVRPDADEGTAAYIVVTLLVGTADDKPLFGEVRTTQELQTALERIAAVQADYLLVFELLWSPQEESDSLTYDELLTEYTEMRQLV